MPGGPRFSKIFSRSRSGCPALMSSRSFRQALLPTSSPGFFRSLTRVCWTSMTLREAKVATVHQTMACRWSPGSATGSTRCFSPTTSSGWSEPARQQTARSSAWSAERPPTSRLSWRRALRSAVGPPRPAESAALPPEVSARASGWPKWPCCGHSTTPTPAQELRTAWLDSTVTLTFE